MAYEISPFFNWVGFSSRIYIYTLSPKQRCLCVFIIAHIARVSWRFNPENCQRHLKIGPWKIKFLWKPWFLGLWKLSGVFPSKLELTLVQFISYTVIRTIPPKKKQYSKITKGAVVESPNINSTNTVNTCKLFMVTATKSLLNCASASAVRIGVSSSREAPETSNVGWICWPVSNIYNKGNAWKMDGNVWNMDGNVWNMDGHVLKKWMDMWMIDISYHLMHSNFHGRCSSYVWWGPIKNTTASGCRNICFFISMCFMFWNLRVLSTSFGFVFFPRSYTIREVHRKTGQVNGGETPPSLGAEHVALRSSRNAA